jgi:hypothetical protein
MIGRGLFGGAASNEIAPGTIFCQRELVSIAGQAEVIYVDTDARGIPHVHYRFTVEPRSGCGPAARHSENRVLALSAFRETFARKA